MLFLGSRRSLAVTAPGGRLGQRARAGVWTLAALFLWATLAPAISRTLDHGTPLAQRGWVPVCSARDMSWVPAAQGQGNGGMAPASHHLDACSLCVLATGRGTSPPSFEGWGLVQRDHGAQHLMSLALSGDLLGIEALCQGSHTLPHQLRA